jgi:hypothetical protein
MLCTVPGLPCPRPAVEQVVEHYLCAVRGHSTTSQGGLLQRWCIYRLPAQAVSGVGQRRTGMQGRACGIWLCAERAVVPRVTGRFAAYCLYPVLPAVQLAELSAGTHDACGTPTAAQVVVAQCLLLGGVLPCQVVPRPATVNRQHNHPLRHADSLHAWTGLPMQWCEALCAVLSCVVTCSRAAGQCVEEVA